MRRFLHLFLLAGLLIALAHHVPYSHPSPSRALAHTEPAHQTADLLYNEARTVHLGNLARRANGIPPLRWKGVSQFGGIGFRGDAGKIRE